MPMMPFIGVRSSWLMIARNSDLAWSARSADSLAFSTSTSLVISRHTTTAPRISPPSAIGVTR